MKFVIVDVTVEPQTVVSEHTVSEIEAVDRSEAIQKFDAFCRDNKPSAETRRRTMYQVGSDNRRLAVIAS